MKIKLISFYSFIYNIILLIVGLISVTSVLERLFIINQQTFFDIFLYLLVAILYLTSFILYLPKLLVAPNTVKIICLYMIFFALNSLANDGGYAPRSNAILSSCCWGSIFSLSYFYYVHNKFSKVIEMVIVLILCVSVILFFDISIISAYSLSRGEVGVMYSTPYYALAFLPFVLMMKNKFVSLALNMGIISCIIISGKRGGFVAYFLALLCYYLQFDNNLSLQKKIKACLKKASLIVCMIFSILVLEDWLTPVDRLSVLQRLELFFTEGNMSGRQDLYDGIYFALQDNNLFEWILGHGFRNTVIAIGNVAHNDFLEVLYDYGLIGLMLVILLLLSLIRDYFKFRKMDLPCAKAFLSSLIITFILMGVSEALITPSYFLIIAMFWGRCYREYQNERLHRRGI